MKTKRNSLRALRNILTELFPGLAERKRKKKQNARLRKELGGLSEYILRDIGMDRETLKRKGELARRK